MYKIYCLNHNHTRLVQWAKTSEILPSPLENRFNMEFSSDRNISKNRLLSQYSPGMLTLLQFTHSNHIQILNSQICNNYKIKFFYISTQQFKILRSVHKLLKNSPLSACYILGFIQETKSIIFNNTM